MLDVVVGFSKEHAKTVKDRLDGVEMLVIDPKVLAPQHIALVDAPLPRMYHYVHCRMETRSLMSAARAGYAGEAAEIMCLYPPSLE